MDNDNYVVIQGWMCNELKLSGNELLVFALIYGFSQDGESEFSGSRTYISKTFNISKPTVDKAIKSLISKGLIQKRVTYVNDIQINKYKATLQGVKKLYGGSKETLHGGSKETLPNNNINIKNNNNNIRFKPPTLEELNEYIAENNLNVDARQFIDYYESNGWKVGKNPMKDWKATVRRWHRTNGDKRKYQSAMSEDNSRDLKQLRTIEDMYLKGDIR